jgi:hypothetical protein
MSEHDPKQESVPAKPGATLKQIGGGIFTLGIVAWIVARVIVRFFFPDLRLRGLTTEALLILIPIWSLVFLGALLWLIGYLRGRTAGS